MMINQPRHYYKLKTTKPKTTDKNEVIPRPWSENRLAMEPKSGWGY